MLVNVTKFSINRKNLTISYRESWNFKEYGYKGIRGAKETTLDFNTIEELEDKVFNFAQGYLNGDTRFAESSTMVRRINWLQDNGYVDDRNIIQYNKITKKVLTGEKSVKINLYQFYSKNGSFIFYNRTGNCISVMPQTYNKRATKFTNYQAQKIEVNHEQLLSEHGLYRVLVKSKRESQRVE